MTPLDFKGYLRKYTYTYIYAYIYIYILFFYSTESSGVLQMSAEEKNMLQGEQCSNTTHTGTYI